ncbi:MAG: MBL fold metallo-hydrolase [Anaerolineales bacterium]|nr:MAG: MBL fold metallo-hydrolase [Anaerolineales bacterium]
MIELQSKTLGDYQTNCYLLIDSMSRDAILVDVPDEAETILSWIEPFALKRIVLTHGHIDHTGALDRVRQSLRVPVAIHPADGRDFNIVTEATLEQDSSIPLGEARLEVACIPGHTQGSIALKVFEGGVFLFAIVGDSIFPGGPGHTASPEALRQSLEALERTVFTWPDSIELHPGHGVSTTVGAERPAFDSLRSNPLPPDLYGDVLWR